MSYWTLSSFFNRFLIGIVAIAFSGSMISNCPATDTAKQLQNAVHRLDARLGSGAKADGWRRYLLLNVLETQSAKGEQADVITLQSIHNQFASGAHGLNHVIFDDVRVAIEQHIQNLSNSRQLDLQQSLAVASQQYRPIDVHTLNQQRDQLSSRIRAFRNFYRSELLSQERAEVFTELSLNELETLLAEIHFEFAPELSVGKLNLLMREVKSNQNKIVKQLDALPVISSESSADEKANYEKLNHQKSGFDKELADLKDQRQQIRKQDSPRAKLRNTTFRQLLKYESKFESAAKTYGDPYFHSARQALRQFSRAYYYATSDNLEYDFLQRVIRLQEDLPKLSTSDHRQAAGRIGNTLEWLENASQVPYLVTAVRAQHSHPNLYTIISSNLINQLGGKSVSESRPVNEQISGRQVRGCATTTGHVSLDLQPDPNQVHLSLRLLADIDSNTYLNQGRITAYVGTSGHAEARRSILANVGGLLAEPPYASAYMNAEFQGTSSRCRLVNRFAGRAFEKKKNESEAGASTRVRTEILNRFSQQSSEPIQKGKLALAKGKAKSKNRSSRLPELFAFSEPDKIVLVGKKTTAATLGSPGKPLPYGMYSDVKVRLNDTLLSNYLEPVFSGKTFTDQELVEELEKLLGSRPALFSSPEEPDPEAEDQSFSITFARARPIQIEFENQLLSVVVSGRKFARGDQEIEEGLKIVLRFRIIRADGKLVLIRDGKTEIEYLSDDKDAVTVAFRSFLDGRLNPQDQPAAAGLDLPSNLIPVDKIEAFQDSDIVRQLVLNQCRLENGWLYLGWSYIPVGQYHSMPIDLPAIQEVSVAAALEDSQAPPRPSVLEIE